MKSIALLLCLVVLAAAIVIDHEPASMDYLAYCKEYNKVYTKEGEQTFLKTVAKINAHNLNPERTYDMGINQFTDMSEEALKAFKGFYSDAPRMEAARVLTDKDLPQAPPDSWDWRAQGAVLPIKDQQQCGVCWAFAATSAVESAFFIDHKQLISLSESQQADCDTAGGCNECAFKYLQTHQACTESSYPYQCPDSRGCRSCTAATPVIKSYAVVQQSNETALKAAVFERPVAIGIAASGDFMNYKNGIFSGSCPGGRDHAVVLVGYGSQNGQNFWILRNSWNTGWGENGYMRIARGGHGNDGICLLATDPSVPYFNK
jgi:KDEL-tailed cysteine endopeptidase